MFKASDARKMAESNKAHVDEVTHLKNHLEQLIKRASNLGKFEIEKQTFAKDRFKEATVEEVSVNLREHGYKVELKHNNALNQIVFIITW